MEESDMIVISYYSNKKKKDSNSLYKSASCPSVFKKNKSIFIIRDKMEKIKFSKNISLSHLTKNNKKFIIKLFEKDNSKISRTSGQSLFDIFNKENIENNELLANLNSLIEKGVYEKSSSDQESQSNYKSCNKFFINKNDVINNQLSLNKNDYIKELEIKIEYLTREVEYLKKDKEKLYNIIESFKRENDISNKYKELQKENLLLKEALLLEKNKKELNDNFKKNNKLINKNENKEQNDFEIKKLINEMKKKYDLGENFNDKKLYEVLIDNDLDIELAFSKLFP